MDPEERKRSLWAFIIIFIALLIIGFLETFIRAEEHSSIGNVVEDALKYQDGVILAWSLPNGDSKIWGNEKLLDENFLPGSLMKLITAEVGLKKGVNPPFHCDGKVRRGREKQYCWTPKGHGKLQLPLALARSCNLYFSNLGTLLGKEALIAGLASYSFSQNRNLGKSPVNTPLLSIGEDPHFKVSPREVKNFWNTYLEKLQDPNFSPIKLGLKRAILEGTATAAASPGKDLLGKTGTADSELETYPTHGWFVGAYPSDQPQWAILVFIKNAHGYREAARLAGKILKRLP